MTMRTFKSTSIIKEKENLFYENMTSKGASLKISPLNSLLQKSN